eukprot:9040195-Prorocentrum_lima.AAC.1
MVCSFPRKQQWHGWAVVVLCGVLQRWACVPTLSFFHGPPGNADEDRSKPAHQQESWLLIPFFF